MQNMQQRFRGKWIKSLQCCRKTIKWINKSNLPKVRLPLKSFFLWILQRWTSQWRKIKKTIGAFSARCRLGKCKRARSRTPTHHLCLTTAWIVHHPSFLGVFLPSSFGSRSNTCKHTHTRARAHGGVGGARLRAYTADSDWSAGRKPLNAVFLGDLFKCVCVSFFLFFAPWFSGFSSLIKKCTDWKTARSHISESAEVTPSRFFSSPSIDTPSMAHYSVRPAQRQQQVSALFSSPLLLSSFTCNVLIPILRIRSTKNSNQIGIFSEGIELILKCQMQAQYMKM